MIEYGRYGYEELDGDYVVYKCWDGWQYIASFECEWEAIEYIKERL